MLYLCSPDVSDLSPSEESSPLAQIVDGTDEMAGFVPLDINTNELSQIAARGSHNNGTLRIATLGWRWDG